MRLYIFRVIKRHRVAFVPVTIKPGNFRIINKRLLRKLSMHCMNIKRKCSSGECYKRRENCKVNAAKDEKKNSSSKAKLRKNKPLGNPTINPWCFKQTENYKRN